MRFPVFADLDTDQKKVFSESPTDGSILIVGPPGSGKTVIAMHRAMRLADSGDKVVITMYNNTLKQYTANFEDLPPSVRIINLHQWVQDWYKSGFDRSPPKDYSASGRFKPYDWKQIHLDIKDANESTLSRLNWGHLIIDEGQDFSCPMYKALTLLIRKINTNKPSLTVFADENQAIHVQNCSVGDMMEALNTSIDESRLWRINKNYRNTLEIAKFSKHFQMLGLRATSIPDRPGLSPKIVFHKDIDSQIDQIMKYAKAQPNKEILVVTQGDTRFMYGVYQKLKKREHETGYLVQGYSGTGSLNLPADSLRFDNGDTLTVMHFQSIKGLEFDTVFVIYQELWFDIDNIGPTYKKLYVTSSRARENLFFLVLNDEINKDPIRILPSPNREICDYIQPPSDNAITNIQWFPTAEDYVSDEYGELAEKLALENKDKIIEIFEYLYERTFEKLDSITVLKDKIYDSNDLPSTILDLIIECGDVDVQNIIQTRYG